MRTPTRTPPRPASQAPPAAPRSRPSSPRNPTRNASCAAAAASAWRRRPLLRVSVCLRSCGQPPLRLGETTPCSSARERGASVRGAIRPAAIAACRPSRAAALRRETLPGRGRSRRSAASPSRRCVAPQRATWHGLGPTTAAQAPGAAPPRPSAAATSSVPRHSRSANRCASRGSSPHPRPRPVSCLTLRERVLAPFAPRLQPTPACRTPGDDQDPSPSQPHPSST
ncbi:MAG: hypothetical protein K0S78_4694 [Thermomicrobiales bacterium]|nr:hypothetical protein [Thermomicrobiales bacterium]